MHVCILDTDIYDMIFIPYVISQDFDYSRSIKRIFLREM